MKWNKLSAALVVGIAVLGTYGPARAGTDAATITEEDIEYGPEVLTVQVGQPIRIENKDPFDHKSRVTFQKANGELGQIALKDHVEKPGTSFTFKLDKPGTYQIRCMLHDGMTATIKVE